MPQFLSKVASGCAISPAEAALSFGEAVTSSRGMQGWEAHTEPESSVISTAWGCAAAVLDLLVLSVSHHQCVGSSNGRQGGSFESTSQDVSQFSSWSCWAGLVCFEHQMQVTRQGTRANGKVKLQPAPGWDSLATDALFPRFLQHLQS